MARAVRPAPPEPVQPQRAAPRPRPDFKAAPPHPEDFAVWCEHPVTRFVAAAMQAAAIKQKAAWVDASWGSGQASELWLSTLRARADAYMAFLETGLEEYARALEE